jgi:membrane protein
MGLAKATWDRFSSRRGSTMAAAIAYRALFALAPMLLVAVALADAIFGEEAAEGLLVGRLRATVGVEIAEAIQQILTSSSGTTTAGVVGIAVLIWAGSGLFTEVVGALNAIYGTEQARLAGIKAGVLQKLTTIAAVLGFGVIMVVLVGAATAAAWLPSRWAAEGVAIAASMLVLVGTIAIGFRYLTVYRIRWGAAVMGAMPTAITIVAAAYGVAIFVSRGGGGASGIAGSIVAVVFAVYILANVGLLGAALTRELDGAPSE